MKSKFARHLGKTSHNAKRTCQTKMAESGQNVDKQSEEGSSVSDTINKQGWLSKRSRLSKRWDKRWCCLKKNELSYGISAEVSQTTFFVNLSLLTKDVLNQSL